MWVTILAYENNHLTCHIEKNSNQHLYAFAHIAWNNIDPNHI